MRKLLIIAAIIAFAATVTAVVATAKPRGANGQITFGRFNPALGDTQIYTINPDGTHEHLLSTDPLEGPRWSPDGSRIATGGTPSGGATRLVDPDSGSFTELAMPDPDLFTACDIWSPDATRLVCESFGFSDPNRNGLYTIRAQDGQGLARLTSNPGGDDLPGDFSPEGNKVVFLRLDANGDPPTMDVVNKNGNGLKQILPPGLYSSAGSWSPQGNRIVFSLHVTADVHSSIWVVNSDGSGLHELDIKPAGTCGGANDDPTADGCFSPDWSPDGKKIVFAKGKSGDIDSNLYTVNTDGTGLFQVTHTGASQAPDWGTHELAH